jgi:hypothetical protein
LEKKAVKNKNAYSEFVSPETDQSLFAKKKTKTIPSKTFSANSRSIKTSGLMDQGPQQGLPHPFVFYSGQSKKEIKEKYYVYVSTYN